MAEPLLVIAGLTAISLATTALFDLLAGPSSWRRKAVWAVLVVSLPLAGPILYYLRAPRERRGANLHRRGAGVPVSTPTNDQPEATMPEDRPPI